MRAALPILAFLLVSCGESEAERAERRYEFLEANGASDHELCAAAKKVANALIDENEAFNYQVWKMKGDLHCAIHERESRESVADEL